MAGTSLFNAAMAATGPVGQAGAAPSVLPAGGAHSADSGSAAMMQAVTGLHMNPLLALAVVVGLIFLTPWCLRRLKQRTRGLLRDNVAQNRPLEVQQALPLGGKRMLFSIAVRGVDGQQATAVILTGGPADLCIGWLGNEQPLKEDQLINPRRNAAEAQGREGKP